MFTSRAEYRLSLREDNADWRLTELGRALGIVDDKRWEAFSKKRELVELEIQRLRSTWVNPRMVSPEASEKVLGKSIEREYLLSDLLKRPNVTYETLMSLPYLDGVDMPSGLPAGDAAEQVEVQVKYEGYIARQKDEILRAQSHDLQVIPKDINYSDIISLSFEVRQKLNQHRPETIGQASRLSGITPAAISLLLIHLKRTKYGSLTEVRAA